MLQSDTCLKRTTSIVPRQIAGELILVPVRQNVGNLESIYTLNETATSAWNLIDGQSTIANIHQQLLEEYEAEPGEVWQDLLELFDSLRELGAVEELSSPSAECSTPPAERSSPPEAG